MGCDMCQIVLLWRRYTDKTVAICFSFFFLLFQFPVSFFIVGVVETRHEKPSLAPKWTFQRTYPKLSMTYFCT